MDPREFYELVTDPPAALLDDYPWLEQGPRGRPGRGLPGRLPLARDLSRPARYHARRAGPPDARRIHRGRRARARLDVPADRGLNFYEVLTLASIVEREAVLDEERALIAGVYQNRIDKLPGVKTGLLNADPTVIYAADTVNLDAMPFDDWQRVRLLDRARDAVGAAGTPRRPRRATTRMSSRVCRQGRSRRRPSPRSMRHWSRTLRTSTSTSWPSPRATARTCSPRPRRNIDANRAEVRLRMTDRWPTPADFAPPPTAGAAGRLGGGGSRRPTRSTGPPARSVRERRDRRLLRRPTRAHALSDRASTSPTARRRSPGNSGQFLVGATRSSCWPIRATRSRPSREAPRPRIAEAYGDLPTRWPELVASDRGAPGRRRGRIRARTRPGRGSRPRLRTSSSSRSRAGWRRTGRSRNRPSWNGSRPRVPWRTGHSRRCSPRSGPA